MGDLLDAPLYILNQSKRILRLLDVKSRSMIKVKSSVDIIYLYEALNDSIEIDTFIRKTNVTTRYSCFIDFTNRPFIQYEPSKRNAMTKRFAVRITDITAYFIRIRWKPRLTMYETRKFRNTCLAYNILRHIYGSFSSAKQQVGNNKLVVIL